ncbi:hypothetical protein QET93_007250 [Akkermansia sp. N21116]|jgi:hypothetical protein|uniref:hypothetical protein n=1 Tax=Akkermansia sp. N21116 TaxID=3040764 RepID=UPI00244EF325|nr:hypothetical protein [Akkermansia sp. N21116]WPX39338.1 hypothetical protein QET93_007250 [Akkermansia sp. N21116]
MDQKANISREDQLVKMLATLRAEVPYPDDFEDRFLNDFQKRSSSEIVRQSSFALFKEHIHAYFQNFNGWKWAYGAMGTCTALIACAIVFSSEGDPGPAIYGPGDSGASTPVSLEQPTLIIENVPSNQRDLQDTEQKEKVLPITRQLADF